MVGVLIAGVFAISSYFNYDELLVGKVKDLRQGSSIAERIAEADLRNENSLFERELMFRKRLVAVPGSSGVRRGCFELQDVAGAIRSRWYAAPQQRARSL